MKFVENLAKAYVNDTYIYGYPAKNILDEASIYVVPMVNPDGVDLVTNALSENSDSYKSQYIFFINFIILLNIYKDNYYIISL